MGGLPYLKAIAGPYIDVQFIPTGGINADNLTTWLAFGRVIACGGSWMVAQEWIRAGDFDRIRTEVEKAVRIAGLPGGN
jgi:2-dehydro-3-deoxyphosphogluconate aldolase/(4S)-4-hydroxy-2-oxoglutarate aldolase